jgi:glycosyltransferase involved in cell wall biosynthesis
MLRIASGCRVVPVVDQMPPHVSVIIPCYNTGRFLRDAIESVLSQSYREFEVIVVDDGSTDGSAAIAESFAGIRVIRQANAGVSAARNRATEGAAGEFVVYLDADDRLLPRALEVGVECLRAHGDCGFVYGFSRGILADGVLIEDPAPAPVHDAGYAALLAGNAPLPPASVMFRRSAVLEAGGFPVGVKLAEDYDLYLRVAARFPVFCHNQVVAEYRQHDANACHVSPFKTMRGAQRAIERQRDVVRGKAELETALRRGLRHWGRIFGPGMSFELLRSVRSGRLGHAWRVFMAVLRHYPRGFWEVARFRLGLLGKSPGRPEKPRP